MTQYEATFEIGSKTDAHAVRILVEQLHNTLREELQGTAHDDGSLDETLQQFERIREVSRDLSPGTLTVVYDPGEGSFDD